jgi:hypothetical protein
MSVLVFDIDVPIVIPPQQVRVNAVPWPDRADDDPELCGWLVTVNDRPMGATMPKHQAEFAAEKLRNLLRESLQVLCGNGMKVFPESTKAVAGSGGS